MEKNERKLHLARCVSQLQSGSLSARDGEDILFSFMFSYFSAEGYEFEHAPPMKDGGIDFVGYKSNPHGSGKIGITYKHGKGFIEADSVHRIVGSNLEGNLDRIIIVTNSRFSHIALSEFHRKYPANVELVDVDLLRSWLDREEKTEEYDFRIVDSLRSELSDKLARLIAENPNYLIDIEWRELERVVQTIFEGLGFASELTPGSKDGGKDVILRCKVDNAQHTYYVELKHWRSKQRVGGNSTKEFLKVIVNEEVNGGLFLSTYGYCNNAFEMLTEIERKLLKFGDQDKIVSLCRQYVLSNSGLWSMPGSLIDSLFCGAI
jgi:HJR/Mrr/RecB family endonuclease